MRFAHTYIDTWRVRFFGIRISEPLIPFGWTGWISWYDGMSAVNGGIISEVDKILHTRYAALFSFKHSLVVIWLFLACSELTIPSHSLA